MALKCMCCGKAHPTVDSVLACKPCMDAAKRDAGVAQEQVDAALGRPDASDDKVTR